MYSLRFSARYPEPIKKELQAMLSAIRRWMTTEHNEDGTHTVEVANTVALIIPDDTVSYAQLQNVSAESNLLGRGAGSGSGDVQEIGLNASLAMAGTTLGVAGFASGAWTPADGSGAGLSFTSVEGRYVRLGPLVIAGGTVTYPVTASGSAAVISGLPVTSLASTNRLGVGLVTSDAGTAVAYQVNVNATTMRLVSPTALSTIANSTLSTRVVSFTVVYLAS